ncbi:MAG: 4Fe-4S binding protein [Solobacterium sp.]|nr:4Fe-4S binding protein [Solobacterium sp.]
MAVIVDKEACIGCGACVGVCPVTALSLDDEGKSECNADTCISCLSCVGTCPVSAIKEAE